MTEAQIRNRIKELVREREEDTPVDWVVTQVINEHDDIDGEDRDFYLLCAYAAVRVYVRSVYRELRQGESKAEAEELFPGFERLQRVYVIDRDEEQVAVRLERMTDAEIDAKVIELRRDAAGCLKHAIELERFKRDRRQAA